MSSFKYMNNLYLGEKLTVGGKEVKCVLVGDYEPADPSVGIFSGYLIIECDNGNQYCVFDNGDIYDEDGKIKLGEGPDLLPDHD